MLAVRALDSKQSKKEEKEEQVGNTQENLNLIACVDDIIKERIANLPQDDEALVEEIAKRDYMSGDKPTIKTLLADPDYKIKMKDEIIGAECFFEPKHRFSFFKNPSLFLNDALTKENAQRLANAIRKDTEEKNSRLTVDLAKGYKFNPSSRAVLIQFLGDIGDCIKYVRCQMDPEVYSGLVKTINGTKALELIKERLMSDITCLTEIDPTFFQVDRRLRSSNNTCR
jgi:hypothetical protein